MDYKFSLAHLTALKCPPPELIYIAGMSGYEYASIRPVYMGLPGEANYALAENKEMLRQTKQAMADTGVQIHDVELFKICAERKVAEYQKALEVGAELGAKCLITSIWIDDKPFYLEQFAELCEMANQYGIKVCLEFVTWATVWNLELAKEVLAYAKTPNAALLLDTLHMYRSRVTPEELAACPDEWFPFIHLCDGPELIPERTDTEALIYTGRDARYYVGEGAIDFKAIMSQIPHTVCSIELPHLERVAQFGAAEHARRCLATAKEYFAKNDVKGRA